MNRRSFIGTCMASLASMVALPLAKQTKASKLGTASTTVIAEVDRSGIRSDAKPMIIEWRGDAAVSEMMMSLVGCIFEGNLVMEVSWLPDGQSDRFKGAIKTIPGCNVYVSGTGIYKELRNPTRPCPGTAKALHEIDQNIKQIQPAMAS